MNILSPVMALLLIFSTTGFSFIQVPNNLNDFSHNKEICWIRAFNAIKNQSDEEITFLSHRVLKVKKWQTCYEHATRQALKYSILWDNSSQSFGPQDDHLYFEWTYEPKLKGEEWGYVNRNSKKFSKTPETGNLLYLSNGTLIDDDI